MLRPCFLISVLLGLQIGGTGAYNLQKEHCKENYCPTPDVVKKYDTYEEQEFPALKLVATRVKQPDLLSAAHAGQKLLVEYAEGANDAGIAFPIYLPTVVMEWPNKDRTATGFSVSLFLDPSNVDAPKPTNAKVHLLNQPPLVLYARLYHQMFTNAELEDKFKEFASDLEADNRSFRKLVYVLCLNEQLGMTEIAFFKK